MSEPPDRTRVVRVEASAKTFIPADVVAVIDYHGRVFRAALIEEELTDGQYSAWVSGPIITSTGREHARQSGQHRYHRADEMPAELSPLALGPEGLRAELTKAAGGEVR